jgi:hypothetical protein
MIAASRIPIGEVRSIALRIWRISSVPSGRARRRGADPYVSAEAPSHLPDGLGGYGVFDATHAVDVSYRGAGHVEGAHGAAGLGASVR